ncbi:MAG: PQQ-dependent sugar dehydrogenase [Pseudomonadota bacterium]
MPCARLSSKSLSAKTLSILAFATALGVTTPATAQIFQSSEGPVQLTAVVGDLDVPWAVAFLPDGQFLITERDGRLWLAGRDGSKREVAGVPEVRAQGQGGLLDVVTDPDFAQNATIYLSYAGPDGIVSAVTAVARARLDLGSASLSEVVEIFRQNESRRGGRHFGSRIVPDGQGNLFITTGDRGDRPDAQDPELHIGKVIRIRPDGSVPSDNPFVSGGALPEIWSIGHRNTQGAMLGPDGALWTISHGAAGGDEINRPEAGLNYGWPVISYGQHYSGGRIGEGQTKPGMEQPRAYWDPSIAPAGGMIYSGKLWPEWQGDLFTGSLKFGFISRVDAQFLEEGAVNVWDSQERMFEGSLTRVRDIREGPDGAIWFLDEGLGALVQMVPAP